MYTPHTDHDVRQMLDAVGAGSLDDLVRVPEPIRPHEPLRGLAPHGLPESEIAARFADFAARNAATRCTSFLGFGAYRHYAPPVLGLAMRGEFLTSYTPYQAEASQGYLQAIYEWQTYVALLTGLDVANASVYDGATALAEGVIMAVNATGRHAVLISRAVHPNYRAVLRSYARGLELEIDEVPYDPATGMTDWSAAITALDDRRHAALVVQSPNVFGVVDVPPETARAAATAAGTVPIGVVAEALSLAVLEPPGEWGAQIAVGEAQSFGVAVAYGGPYVGFIAAKQEHLRRIPGRLVGKTVDRAGRPAFVLTLQAREQHIRRERATSNICTNQAHCALVATIYLAALGRTGLRDCAVANLRRRRELATALAGVPGLRLAFPDAPTFNELVVRRDDGGSAGELLAWLEEREILGGVALGRWYPELADAFLITATELTTSDEIARLVDALRELPWRAAAATSGVAATSDAVAASGASRG